MARIDQVPAASGSMSAIPPASPSSGSVARGGIGDYQVWPGLQPIGAIRSTPLRLALACCVATHRT
jgi:hypothetical protein